MVAEHLVINCVQNFLVGCAERNHGEVAGKTQINDEGAGLGIEATKEHDVLESLLLLEVLSIENQLIVNDLADEADRGLGAVLVKLGHVEVVHKEHEGLTGGWTENSTHTLVDVRLNDGLESLGVSVGTHVHG